MNVKAYYKRNISYNFDEQKQRNILKNSAKENLQKELKRQLEIQKGELFDKVNSRVNNRKMITLLKSLIKNA